MRTITRLFPALVALAMFFATAPVQAWSNVIKHCYQYGRASVIGYVWTNYGRGG